MWTRVIRSIYGKEGGLEEEGGTLIRAKNSVWVNIIKTGRHLDSMGLRFSNSFREGGRG